MSSGKAEYYAAVRAAAEGLAVQALMADLGWEAEVRVFVDATAAKSIASRIGLGKVRHMEVKFLWLQEAVKMKRIKVMKVPGQLNPADVPTKPMSIGEMDQKIRSVGGEVLKREG